MKRGTPDHPKLLDLMDRLDAPKYAAIGLLEALWHWTAQYAPAGDVGRYSDRRIAYGVGWEGQPDELVEALVSTRWLDRDDVHRLVVHDWHDHCDDGVHMALARKIQRFASGQIPSLTRFGRDERERIAQAYDEAAHGAHTACAQGAHGVRGLEHTRRRTAEAEPEPSHSHSQAEASAQSAPTPCPARTDARGSGSVINSRHGSISDSLPPEVEHDDERSRALQHWLMYCDQISAHSKTQQRSDRTSAANLFDRHVWPPGCEDGEDRMKKAVGMIDEARQAARNGHKPMAILTKRIKDRWSE